MKIVGGYPQNEGDKLKLKLRLLLEEYKDYGDTQTLIEASRLCEWHGIPELGEIIALKLNDFKETNKYETGRMWEVLEALYDTLESSGLKQNQVFERMALAKGIDPDSMKRMWYNRKRKRDN